MAPNACIPPVSPMEAAPPNTTAATEHTVPTSSVVPLIRNVVATANLGCPLDLAEIVRHMWNVEYRPTGLNAIIARRRSPKATALIFGTGKLVITGAASEADARLAAKKNARIIQKQGYPVRFQGFRIHNIVGRAAIGDETEGIHLDNLARDYREFVSYEPEQSAGLQYQMSDPKVTLVISHRGKIVALSARTQQDLNTAFEKILPIVRQYPLRITTTTPETGNSKET